MGKGTYDDVLLLDAYCPRSITADFQTSPDQDYEEVVGFIPYDGLNELDDHGNGVEDRTDDGKWEVGAVKPDGIWICVGHFAAVCLCRV